MENLKAKLWLVSVGLLTLAGCQNYTRPPEYFPGYYQEAKYHPANYERPYYDYYGNYHAGYIAESYEEAGRWHRASVLTADNIGKAVYIEPAQIERTAQKEAGQVAADKTNINPVIE